MSQARIMRVISKMNNSLPLKSYERRRFKVVKFHNRIVRLIHQMWDEMVTMIVVEKDTIMETISEMVQIDVEGSFVIELPRSKKRMKLWKKIGRKRLTTLS
jgi:L-lactate utilization protein LutC